MPELRHWLKGAGRTLKAIAPDLFHTCVVGPLVGRGVARAVPQGLSGPGRLAGLRALASKTVDGAVVAGRAPAAGAKFTIKHGLPTEEGERRLIIENEPHTLDGFSGRIEEGYGKGTKTLIWRGRVVVKTEGRTSVETVEYHFHNADKAGPHYDLAVSGVRSQQRSLKPKPFEIHFLGGPLAGKRYSIVNTIMKEGEGGRMAVVMKDQGLALPKPEMNVKDREWLKTQDPQKVILERKYDGSLANASLSSTRAAFHSHRPSGSTYYDKLPSLEFLSNTSRLLTSRWLFQHPSLSNNLLSQSRQSLNGTVLKGEITHTRGAAKVAGILNSHADKARAWQAVNGDAEFYAWDIVKYRGRDVSGWEYARRRGLLEKVVGEIRHFNKNWHVAEKAPSDIAPEIFYEYVTEHSGGLPWSEGVIVKPRDQADGWVKVKASDDHDLVVSGFVEGQGKYAGSLGAIEILNPATGETGEVGSLAVTDEYRSWIWEHREALKGAVARVKAMELTEARGVPRAGVFQGFHENKGSEEALAVLASREI